MIVPDTVVIDRGRVFVSEVFVRACEGWARTTDQRLRLRQLRAERTLSKRTWRSPRLLAEKLAESRSS